MWGGGKYCERGVYVWGSGGGANISKHPVLVQQKTIAWRGLEGSGKGNTSVLPCVLAAQWDTMNHQPLQVNLRTVRGG